MKNPISLLLIILGAMLAAPVSCGADEPAPMHEEPFATFDRKLKAFAAQPTENGLRDLKVLCLRLPVRDKRPDQIGAGHPLDREDKLTCMLRFVDALDRVIRDLSALIATAPGPVEGVGGDSPENSLAIMRSNFRIHLERTRKTWATRELPDFLGDVCRNSDPAQLRAIIRSELKSDPDAAALSDELSRKMDAR